MSLPLRKSALLLTNGGFRSAVALARYKDEYELHLLRVNWRIPGYRQYDAALGALAKHYDIQLTNRYYHRLSFGLNGFGLPCPDWAPHFRNVLLQLANAYASIQGFARILYGGPACVDSVFPEMSDEDIVREGVRLRVPFELTADCPTVSFYARSCGACTTCTTRRALFTNILGHDPTIYH